MSFPRKEQLDWDEQAMPLLAEVRRRPVLPLEEKNNCVRLPGS